MFTKQNLIDAAKDAPIPSAAAIVLAGVSLQDWVLILTLVWAVIRAADAALSFYHKWKTRKEERDARK